MLMASNLNWFIFSAKFSYCIFDSFLIFSTANWDFMEDRDLPFLGFVWSWSM